MKQKNPAEIIEDVEAGFVASHPLFEREPLLVAPTTASKFNTLSLALQPLACLSFKDAAFEFDSSFPKPNVTPVLARLPALREKHKQAGQLPVLSLFGHADPTGDDDYNKKLSGRRATAIYALLTRRTDLWEQLHQQPMGGDNWQSKNFVSFMKNNLPEGTPEPATRQETFLAYMNAICPVTLAKEEFLGRGADPGGKVDFQGCSEFNPMLVLTVADNNGPKPERDEANTPNRRVVIFLFHPGVPVSIKEWPCPRVKEGTAACHDRFFANGDTRRKAGAVRRKYSDKQDTFACRFYDEFARFSPCEGGVAPLPMAGHIYANFDRVEGGQNVDKVEDRRKLRLLRPGAIVLPNLDVDEDPAKARARFGDLDALFDDKINDGDDDTEPTNIKIAEPPVVTGIANRIILEIDPADVKRVRVWRVPKGKTLKDGVVVIGPGKGNKFVVQDRAKGIPPKGWEEEFFVEALTLGGDVDSVAGSDFRPAPSGLAPPPPGAQRTPLPDKTGGSAQNPDVNNSDTGNSVYQKDKRHEDKAKAARAAGDVWVNLIHESGGASNTALRDVGLATIAPWIMLWNTLPTIRVYVVSFERLSRPAAFLDAMNVENHSTVWELNMALFLAGHTLPPDTDTRKIIPVTDRKNVRTLNDTPFYIVSSNRVGLDSFIQDQFEVGYCLAPHKTMHVAAHLQRLTSFDEAVRRKEMSTWTLEDLPHAGLALYNGLSITHKNGPNLEFQIPDREDSVNFGGNLEVSPPILKEMKADLPAGAAGPAVKKHRKAPFGKIILGDSTDRPVAEAMRRFLIAQKVQPVVPLDTSWLSVGHVDEFMSFIRSSGALGFKMPFASAFAMNEFLDAVIDVNRDATLHAGCYHMLSGVPPEYAEDSVEMFRLLNGGDANFIDSTKLVPIRDRLNKALLLAEDDSIPIPIYFKPQTPDPLNPAAARNFLAESIGTVNMLVVNNSLILPRPFGPRMTVDEATKVLTKAFKSIFSAKLFGSKIPEVRLPGEKEHFFWARPGESLNAIAMYFVRPAVDAKTAGRIRRELIQRLQKLTQNKFDPTDANWDLKPLGKPTVDAVKALVRAIIRDNIDPGSFLTDLTPVVTPGGLDFTFNEWMRLKIPDDTVDVMEGYLMSVLEPTGNGVHFVSSFEILHSSSGEVHCGTNTIRRNPEFASAFKTRWWDKGVYDPDFDASYSV
jgi:hypothetical protein